MGKKKLEIKARETKESKQVTFSKRRMGLEKKAQQLSTLCDIPLLLLLFSPGQRLSWISGSYSTPEELLMRYADIPFEERKRRKIEVLEQLSRAFRKSDHKVNVEEFLWNTAPTPSIKDVLTHLQRMRTATLQKLREYEMPKTIEQASQLKEILRIRLQQIYEHWQLMESKCTASYNQTLIEEEALSISNQRITSYTETLGQQRCSEDSKICGIMDVTCHDASVPSIFEHGSISSFSHQGALDTVASSCLPNCSIFSESCFSNTLDQLEKQPMCACLLPTCLDHMFYQNGGMFQEHRIFERDANYDPLLSFGEDHSFLGNPHLKNGDFSTSNIVHHTTPFQHLFEYEDIKPLNLPSSNTKQM